MKRLLYILICSLVLVGAPADSFAKKTQTKRVNKTSQQQKTSKSSKQKSTKNSQPRTIKAVKQEQKQTAQDIEKTKKQISENTAQTRRQLNRLTSLSAELTQQGIEIDNMQVRLNNIQRKIDEVNDSISQNENKVATLKKGFTRSLTSMRDHRHSLNKWAFVFSSESFSQAWRRLRYLNQVQAWQSAKTNDLKDAINTLQQSRDRMTALQNEHKTALERLNIAQNVVKNNKKEAENLVENLKRESSSLKKVLAQKQQQANRLDNELERIIAEEARKAEEARRAEEARKAEQARKAEEARRAEEARKAELAKKQEEAKAAQAATKDDKKSKSEKAKADKATADNSNKRIKREDAKQAAEKAQGSTVKAEQAAPKPKQESTYDAEAAADRRLTGSFRENKGRLLFPVTGKYKVVSTFGRSNHPELSKVQVQNSGIDIEVPQGASARCVYDGVVSSVFRMEGYNNIVIIRHGEYLTVYAGIDKLYIKKGDKVKANQSIGTVRTDADDDNRTILHFEIRLEKQKLNPLEWVK